MTLHRCDAFHQFVENLSLAHLLLPLRFSLFCKPRGLTSLKFSFNRALQGLLFFGVRSEASSFAASWVSPAKLPKSSRSRHNVAKLRRGGKPILPFPVLVVSLRNTFGLDERFARIPRFFGAS
jgi:hypothetical protein